MENKVELLNPTQNKALSDEDAKFSKCTYNKYGKGSTIRVDLFWCWTCSKYLCEECLFVCHNQDCLKLARPPEPYYSRDNICDCGLEGHVDQKKTNTQISSECNLYEIYKHYPHANYTCETCNKDFCFLCFNECHSRTCSIEKFTQNNNSDFKCNCYHYNHNDNNFLFRFINNSKVSKYIYISRLYANAFKRPVMDKYWDVIDKTISEGEHFSLSSGDYNLYEYDIFYLFDAYRKECEMFLYYPEILSQKFPYKKLKDKMFTWDNTKTCTEYVAWLLSEFKYRYNYTLSILHLKNDFKDFKKLSTHYYLNTSLTERLKLRFLVQTTIKSEKYAKYDFFGNLETNFFAFINHQTETFKHSYSTFRLLDILLARTLKIHVYKAEDIVKLTKVLHKATLSPDAIYYKNKINDLSKIALIYNDALLFENLNKDTVHDNIAFLHSRSDFGEMFLKNYLNYGTYMGDGFNQNDKNWKKKSIANKLALFKEIMKLFSLADNSFSEDFEKFENDGYQDYCRFVKLYNDINDPKKANLYECKFATLLKNLASDIDDECRKFYYFESFPSAYFQRTTGLFGKFSDTYAKLLQEFKTDSDAQRMNIKTMRHFNRVVGLAKKFFPFATLENFNLHISSPLFIEVLKITYFIRKLFLILESLAKEQDCREKEIVLETVYSFISLLTTTRPCLEYLISNNILKRINSQFENFKPQSLELIYAVLKGLKLHSYEIKFKKSAQSLTETMVKYFLTLKFSDFKAKSRAILTIKILCLLSENLDVIQMKEVRRTIFIHLEAEQFFSQERFRNSFPNLNHDKYSKLSIKQQAINNAVDLKTAERKETEEGIDEKAFLLKPQPDNNDSFENPNSNFKRRQTIPKSVKLKFLSFYNFIRREDAKKAHNTHYEEEIYGQKANTCIDQTIFFSLFKLVSYNTFFILKNDNFKECIDKLHDFNDVDYFIKLLASNYISLDKRTHLLKYLYAMYFLDVVGDATTNQNLIGSEDLSKYERYKEYLELIEMFKNDERNTTVKLTDLMKILTKEDYKYIKYRTLLEPGTYEGVDRGFDKLFEEMKHAKDIEAKYVFSLRFMKVIDVYIQEIENMTYWIYSTKNDVKDIESYVNTLMDLMRYLSDFFWDVYKKTNIYNQIIKKYYQLGAVFINNIENIKKILDSFTDPSTAVKSVARTLIINPKLSSGEIPFVRNYRNIDKYFDIMKIYHNVLEGLNYLNIPIMKDEYLQSFYESYDKQVSKDFFTVGIEFDGKYEDFYESKAKTAMVSTHKHCNPHISHLFKEYRKQFKNIRETSFFVVLGNLSTDPVIRKAIANLFFKYYEKNIYLDEDFEYTITYIITKILYFDTHKYQDILSSILTDNFFINYFSRIQTALSIYTAACDKFYTHNKYAKYMNMKTKIMLQFIQLLGEGFYKGFLDKIFNNIEVTKEQMDNFFKISCHYKSLEYEFLKPTTAPALPQINNGDNNLQVPNENNGIVQVEVNKLFINIYKHFYDSLIYINKFFLNLGDWDFNIQYHLSDDHLVILLSNLTALIIEYNGNFNMSYNGAKLSEDNNQIEHKPIIELIKDSLSISSILFKRESNLYENRKHIILFSKLNYLDLLKSFAQNKDFEELVKDLNDAVSRSKLFEEIIYYLEFLLQKKRASLKDKGIVNRLIKMYIKEPWFEQSEELEFCIEAFKYIHIISSTYNDNEMIKFYESIDREDGFNFNSDEFAYDSLCGYRAYKFLSTIVLSVTTLTNIENEEGKEEKSISKIYFLKSPFSFHLSEQTKQKFLDLVDRTSATTKIKELIGMTDYFVFEMLYNFNRFSLYPPLESFNKIQMYYFEMFNYVLVILHQILLFINFSKKKTMYNIDDMNLFSEVEKFALNKGNEILSYIQIVYLALTLTIWAIVFSRLNFQKIMMETFHINFIVSTQENRSKNSQRVIKFTDDFLKDNVELRESLNDSVSVWDKIKVVLFDLILFNREVNFLVLDVILLILYLTTGNSICLVIPVILITNLSAFLYDIFFVIQMKWKQLCLVLIYTYLLVYLFSWIAFLYFYELFNTETFDIPSVIIILIFRELLMKIFVQIL
jgi:hypothetical protein